MTATTTPIVSLSPADAAAVLGISKRTMSRLLSDSKIKARRSGCRTLVDFKSMMEYYESLPPIMGPRPVGGAVRS